MGLYSQILFLVILISLSLRCHSWGWFSSTTETYSTDNSQTHGLPHGSVVEFSMNGLSDEKGMKLVEKAKSKMVGMNSCWQNAYQHLFAGCSQILAIEEKRWRFAWHLSDCFQKDSGRPAFPYCDTKSAMVNCLKMLNDNEHKVYLEFSLETNSICYQLQAHAFNHKMERLVNDLKNSAEYTEEQLEIIEGKTHVVLQRSNQIQDSLSSIDIQVENIAQTTKDAKDHMDVLSKHSEAVYKHSKEIAHSQSELQEGQAKMNENLKDGMSMLHDAYTNLGQEVDNVRNEAVEIEKQIGRVGDTLSSKMQTLQTSADDIENMAGKSLDKQKQLLDGQSNALKGLQLLTQFQSEALEESRSMLQHFAEYGHKQQEELLQRQEQLQKVHDHLVENSNSILAAQEAFESKQASMFISLEKLFALQNAMLLESRIIKTFVLYTASIFIVYMFTSTKQTYTIRARLYVGLVATFLAEVAMLRLTTNSMERQTWLINVFRLLYGILASIQFLHAIFTYRDYEVLNHHLILSLMDKINVMQKNRELSWETESDVDWSSWIQTELAEGDDNMEDPDFIVPEEVEENSNTASMTRKYDLRCRQPLSKESLPEIATVILDSLDECMKMSEHVLDEDQTDLFLKTIMNLLQKISSLSRSRVGAIEGINQTLPDEENGEEQKVYDKAADCLTTFIRTHRNTFSPFIGKLAPCIELMWVKDRIVEERRTALHVFCDVAKQFQEEAFRRYKISLLFLFKACKDENPEVQEVAAQAIGTAAEFGGSVFKSSVKGSLSALNAVMGHPKALEMEYVMAHDTAVSALGKILEFHREKLKAEKVLRIWLGHLPLKNNLEEAKVVHRQLCSLVEVSDVELLGTQKAYLSEIVAVYAEILWAGKKLATEETVNQMIKQLKLHRRRSPHSTWRSIMLSLELHLQKKLESMLTS